MKDDISGYSLEFVIHNSFHLTESTCFATQISFMTALGLVYFSKVQVLYFADSRRLKFTQNMLIYCFTTIA